jgi:hypothetical protein
MMALHLLFSFEHEIINMYIIYLVHVTNSRKPRTPMSHLQLYAFSLRCSKTLHGLRG